MQGDLWKSSTFPKELGHLVTFILVERPNLARARLVSNICFPEVVKSPVCFLQLSKAHSDPVCTLIAQAILLSIIIELLISVLIN